MTEAERIEACQWRGYAFYTLNTGLGAFQKPGDEQTAYKRGFAGIRPDTAAIAAAEARGKAEGRREVLAVVRARREPLAASEWHTMESRVTLDTLTAILRACGETV